jgi:hypothetical protein
MDLVIWDKNRKIPKVELSIKQNEKSVSDAMDKPEIKNKDLKTCKENIKIADIKIDVFLSANYELSFGLKFRELKTNHAGFDKSKFPKIEFKSETNTNMEIDDKKMQIKKPKINLNKTKNELSAQVLKHRNLLCADDTNCNFMKIEKKNGLSATKHNKKNTKQRPQVSGLFRNDKIGKFAIKDVHDSELRVEKSKNLVQSNLNHNNF